MVTKAKGQAPDTKVSPDAFEARFGAALALCSSGKVAEGKAQLEALLGETTQPDRARAIRVRLAALNALPEVVDDPTSSDALAVATLHLNARRPEEALQILNQAREGGARLNYLKATAYVQLGHHEEAAGFLKQALDLDPALVYVARLEPDFKVVRSHPAFQYLG